MNLENVIVCAICLVAIAIVGYFMYTKYNAQNIEMLKLAKRCETIEMLFARPPPPDDLQAMYKPKYAAPQQHQASQPTPRSPPCEVEGMCDLEPLRLETNDDELDVIVNEELTKVIETEKTPRKKKTQTRQTRS